MNAKFLKQFAPECKRILRRIKSHEVGFSATFLHFAANSLIAILLAVELIRHG